MAHDHITLQEYLERERRNGAVEFRLVLASNADNTQFYIHPLGRDGDSRDFTVEENSAADVTQWLPE